jgi:hypothetical protein
MVHSYRIRAKDKATGNTVGSFLAFSEFYRDPVPAELSFPLNGLTPGKDYTVEVTAIDSFGNESAQPLQADLHTRPEKGAPTARAPTMRQPEFAFPK